MPEIPVPKVVVTLDVPDGTTLADIELFAAEFFAGLKVEVRKRVSDVITGWLWKVDAPPLGRVSGGEVESG